ncbi:MULTISPECIES: pentapeptide repeat-containing protein [Pseudofrankia]|uniref:pentapeptide repeat-containing protein n=1 Tax=Pseudofrankia TaxID=2994363 RepID=UPI000234C448|nr:MULTISPECIES: pentapeptide repeat-containing protein [Pseudofrankia]OHV39406.1 hypothetical protein BCD49_39995 [Pseudofrankia sp. EUN1h]
MATTKLNRKHLIITALVTIGLISIVIRAVREADYSLVDAAYGLAYEALPTALFYVLTDSLIGRFETRQQRRLDALRRLRGAPSDSNAALLDDIAVGNELRLADMIGAQLEGIEIRGKRIPEGRIDGANADRCHIIDCRVANLSARGASLRLAVFDQSSFTASSFHEADLSGALFASCNLQGRDYFRGASMADVRFVDCSFGPGVLEHVPTVGPKFIRCTGAASG